MGTPHVNGYPLFLEKQTKNTPIFHHRACYDTHWTDNTTFNLECNCSMAMSSQYYNDNNLNILKSNWWSLIIWDVQKSPQKCQSQCNLLKYLIPWWSLEAQIVVTHQPYPTDENCDGLKRVVDQWKVVWIVLQLSFD